MIYLIILSAVLFVALLYMIVLYSKSKQHAQRIKQIGTFTNDSVAPFYNEFCVYLKGKKSKLSLESKVDILNLYCRLLTALPKKYRDAITVNPNLVNLKLSTLTAAEHKKALIEALEELCDSKEISDELLEKLSYHLYYLIFM